MRLKFKRSLSFLLAFGLVFLVFMPIRSSIAANDPFIRFWYSYDGEGWTQAGEDAGAVCADHIFNRAARENGAWQFKVGERAWFPIDVSIPREGFVLEITLDNPSITDGVIRDPENSEGLSLGSLTYCDSNGRISAVTINAENWYDNYGSSIQYYDEMYMIFKSAGSLIVTATLKENGKSVATKQIKFNVTGGTGDAEEPTTRGRIIGKWNWENLSSGMHGTVEFFDTGRYTSTSPLPMSGDYTVSGANISMRETTYGTGSTNKGVISFVTDDIFTVAWEMGGTERYTRVGSAPTPETTPEPDNGETVPPTEEDAQNDDLEGFYLTTTTITEPQIGIDLEATKGGGTSTTIYVTAPGEWVVEKGVKCDWIELNTKSGTGNGSFSFEIAPNKKNQMRIGQVWVEYGGSTRHVTVTQLGGTYSEKEERDQDHLLQNRVFEMIEQNERFSEDFWYQSSNDDRKEILSELLVKLNGIMDTGVRADIHYDSIPGTTVGNYSFLNKQITINERFFEMDNSYIVLKCLVHEMRHGYQHEAIRNPDKHIVSEETRAIWEKNAPTGIFDSVVGNYIVAKDDRSNRKEYLEQPIEWDANNFAKLYELIEGLTPVYGGSWI